MNNGLDLKNKPFGQSSDHQIDWPNLIGKELSNDFLLYGSMKNGSVFVNQKKAFCIKQMRKKSIHVFSLAHFRYTCLLVLIVFLWGCRITSTVQTNQNMKTGEIPIR